MRITDWLYLVGSGQVGFRLTDDYDCHVYLLDGGDEYALIDAGGGRSADEIVAQIAREGLDPQRAATLFVTHAHVDHAGGAAGLRERLGLQVAASPEVAQYLRSADERGSSLDVAREGGVYPLDFVFEPCPVDRELADGDTVQVGDLVIEALETPGHSAGHLSYIVRRSGEVSAFTGDALFAGGAILLQNIWDCSLHDSIRSVERLAALSLDGLYPGHATFAVRDGRREVDKAMDSIRQRLPPRQLH